LAQQKLKGPVRAKVAPSDIVQMTIWNVTQDFEVKQFRDRKGFVAWVTTILRNVAADERRRFQDAQKRDIYREHPLNSPESQKWLRQLSVTLSGTHSVVSRTLVDVETVLAAIQTLPPHYQLIIRMRYYEQLKFEDIGRALKRSTDAARVMHGRALKKLRDILLSLNGPASPNSISDW
jgi:RNA polymerase sigma-70 factor (ECF subfamily)